MSKAAPLGRRLLISACAMTRTTDRLARRVGATAFLPALFTLRYANMGGLDRAAFARELDQARSFSDAGWCAHWDAIAARHLALAQDAVDTLSAGAAPSLSALTDAPDGDAAEQLAALWAPAVEVLADHGPQPSHAQVDRLARELAARRSATDPEAVVTAAVAVDELVKAMTYWQVGAFPGTTPGRMRAYWRSRRLFDALVPALRAGLGLTIEPFSVATGGDVVDGYAFFPDAEGPHPAVLATNGLEGTVQELFVPNLRHRDRGLATFMMEMPGSYAYKMPMTEASEAVYHQVLDHVARDARVDPARLGMLGVSFGGYWSTRLAATSRALAAVISCGAPTHLSFKPGVGTPEIIVNALAKVTGTKSPIATVRALQSLSLRDRYQEIEIPLLVINGDHDTLLSTQDSIDLAAAATRGELKLYEDDDHCAMGHYLEWQALAVDWLSRQLAAKTAPR